ncbi:2-amino-4-hydroxy-6-hydroxymethyldihydropteridine diphosphokinase [Blastomonas sp.]|uniref:2-amino-4-hydroxy-6- hydroxymethyldihydropteridine diphosphokinase n=1 Tax=Blastomonas sp. TaxID=1909299 RepID=UPI0035942BCB
MDEAIHHDYLIALGSNRRHHLVGSPARVLAAALIALAAEDIDVLAASPLVTTRPIGPSRRSYINGAAVIRCGLWPDELLTLLKHIEASFGARRGQRWAARTLDLDIILWSGGRWQSRAPDLVVPHRLFRERGFVLGPARVVAPGWRDPCTRLTIRQLHTRLTRA